ncbi:N-acetylglucosaminyl deacetylase, LmbE family [Nocardioides exalbidus]|uniref:N-acetylglucosaminyl deacetylase, LmbE family n=1 Tax=Nocardioides exalbidus TaxID=402596 RepID=A0A1H4L9I7_9ACTN|nr:PIG-L deacetylase family protein [Nocardioides exalbidus]SEB67394.1 N-acetylglucosaminyl deacetylase, LmbE family [Nocardioides exalbidus]
MRRLVIAPHMDDESLGCGGLLAKHPEDATVLVVTQSGDTRRQEHAKAMEVLGISDFRCLDFDDGTTQQHMTDLVQQLDRVMSDVQPEEIYLPFPSLHQDHIGVYEAGMRSSRLSMSPNHWVPNSVLVYDIAVYDVNLYPSDLRWNVFEALSEEHADLKAAACAAYLSENPGGAHPMNSIKEIAATVGHMRKVEFAEQYALVRQVRR